MKISGIAYMFASVVLFSLANILVKKLGHLPVYELVFMRSTISFALCAVYVIYKRLPFLGVNKKWLIIRGISGMIALTMFFYTLQHIPLASATVIQYLSPVFTVILAVVFLKERIRLIQWLLLAIAFGGILLVKGFDTRISLFLLAVGIGSAVLSSVAYFATIKCKDTDHPVAIVMYFHMIATPVMGAVTVTDYVPLSQYDWVLGLSIGLLSVIAQISMAIAIHREDASKVVPIKYVGAIFALAIGYYMFDESLNKMSIIGIFVVIAAVTLNTILKGRKPVSTTYN